MARVLVLSLIFSPDNVSTAHIVSGIAADLKACGHDLCVITTTPHYHRDLHLEAEQPLRAWLPGVVKRSCYKGMPVYHVVMPNKHCGKLMRIASWLAFHVLSTLVSLCIRFRPDVILVPSPPLSIGINACLIAWLTRSAYIYNVQELYPDIAVNLGVVRQKGAIRFLSAVERFIYNHAAAVTSITESIHAKVQERVRDRSKAWLIPNFVDLSDVVPAPRANAFSLQHRIERDFVVTYAGNLGVPQNLSVLVSAAERLRGEAGLTILIVGDGTEKEALRQQAQRAGLDNVRVVDYQPLSVMPDIYASSDVFFVGQTLGAHTDGIPSKIYRIMANGKPVLAVTPPSSDLAACLEASGAGTVITSGGADELAQAVRRLRANPELLGQQGRRARDYVMRAFTREAVSRQYDERVRAVEARRA